MKYSGLSSKSSIYSITIYKNMLHVRRVDASGNQAFYIYQNPTVNIIRRFVVTMEHFNAVETSYRDTLTYDIFERYP